LTIVNYATAKIYRDNSISGYSLETTDITVPVDYISWYINYNFYHGFDEKCQRVCN